MLGEYYRVLKDFNPNAEQAKDNVLPLEKGDIVVDVEKVDAQWVTGRNMLSQQSGKILRSFLTEFNEAEPAQDNETKLAEKSASPKRTGIQVTVNPLLRPDGDGKSEAGVVGNSSQSNGASFKSAYDEGYNSGNSCSNDSGERIVLTQTEPTVLEDKIVELPHRPARPAREKASARVKRTESFQDEDGYEIPILSQTTEHPLEEINAEVRTPPPLKFTFGKKFSSAEQETSLICGPKNDVQCVKHKPSSVGSESTFSDGCGHHPVTSNSLRATASPDHVVFTTSHRTKILVFLLVSAVVSLSCFLIWLVACGWPVLLSFCLTLVVFVVLLVGPFTLLKGRIVCVLLLILPSFFASRFKSTLLVVLCCLLLVGPACNIARNLTVPVDCQVTTSADSNDSRQSNFTARAMELFPVEMLTDADKNSTNVSRDLRDLYSSCTKSLSTLQDMCSVVRTELSAKCSSLKSMNNTSLSNRWCSGARDICRTSRQISDQCERLVASGASIDAASAGCWRDCLGWLIVQLAPLLVLIVLYEAYTYHRLYLTNKTLDNVYITRKLKVIDCERGKRGLTNTLFPLRKAEFRRYLLPSSMGLTRCEFNALMYWLVVWAAICLVSLAVINLDRKLHAALSSAYLPRPSCGSQLSPVHTSLQIAIYVILGVFLGVILLSCHVLRMRSRICAVFYPKREITRIMHLYYTILDERERFWGVHRRKVQLLAEARRLNAKHNLLLHIHGSLPVKLQQLWEKASVQRCMVCRSLAFKRCFVCLDQDCSAVFCYECYIDAGGACVACRPSINSGSSPCCEYVETR